MRTSFIVAAGVALVLLVLPVTSPADSFYYEVTGVFPVSGPCNYVEVPFPLGVPYTMDGYFVLDQPTQSVSFRLPDQGMMDYVCPGSTVGSPTFYFPTTTDPTGAYVVEFGECLSGTTLVFTNSVTLESSCTLGGIFGTSGFASEATSVGCDSAERPIHDLSGCTAPPINMMPADGATGVSLNPTLSYEWTPPAHCPEGIGLVITTLYFGTTPDNLQNAGWNDSVSPFTVGPLALNTTYYWQLRLWDDFWNCPGCETAWSPVMSFTTVDEVAAEAKTWGSIKAGYRKKPQ